jgi:hypothetical protein
MNDSPFGDMLGYVSSSTPTPTEIIIVVEGYRGRSLVRGLGMRRS